MWTMTVDGWAPHAIHSCPNVLLNWTALECVTHQTSNYKYPSTRSVFHCIPSVFSERISLLWSFSTSLLFAFVSVSVFRSRSELAKTNILRAAAAVEKKNKKVVRRLYEALGSGDAKTVQRILAPQLEWWFHGPPSCQHLMRLLTGRCTHTRFSFVPDSITALSHNLVVAEGREDESVYWVHVWTLDNADCTVTELREYFNTSLVVTEFNPPSSSASTPEEREQIQRCSVPLWQSELLQSNADSMPGLVLAL